MSWKPEYELNRKAREAANPELREKRIASAIKSQQKDPEARKAYMRAYYQANPEKFPKRTQEQRDAYNAKRRDRYAKDEEFREKVKDQARWWQRNPEKKRESLLKQYGLTPQDFESMMDRQSNSCAICGFSELIPKIFPAVDHCHQTGRVRGLLCINCNQGLGKFKDNRELLLAAISYLGADHGSSGSN